MIMNSFLLPSIRLFIVSTKMSDIKNSSTEKIDVVLPRQGLLYQEENLDYILCKPKLIPLKSITLEKLERMQRDAELKIQEATEEENNEENDE
ncbi:BBSome interacting protein 1 isoform X1 [Nomia melanderi]|uniref:BBSome interacting protein 1 isoform X1 n=2 Tax=Nomia melanderi TaxID=2448451 RepID=UPI003FCC7EB0